MRNDKNEEDFSWDLIWKIKASLRVAFCAWEAARGCILTLDNLIRKREGDFEQVLHVQRSCGDSQSSLTLVPWGLINYGVWFTVCWG